MDGNNAKDGIPSFKTMNSREQKLVDICFQLVLTATDRNFKKELYKNERGRKSLVGCKTIKRMWI